MYIIKRNQTRQIVDFSKISNRIKKLTIKEPFLNEVDPNLIAQQVISGLYTGATTVELDNLAAETAVYMSTVHPEYEILASRLATSNLHKITNPNYEETCDVLYNHINPKTGEHAPLLSKECYDIIKNNINVIQAALNYEQDYTYDYFAIKTLQNSYLIKINGKNIERIQHMLMRVAIGVHKNDIESALKSYHLLSQKYYTLATPTLFNAGTVNGQLSSCFVAGTEVCTLSGVKNIEDVKIGDEVITHTGAQKKVLQLHKNLLGERKLYNLKCDKTPNITVTGNHRVYAIKRKQSPEWVPVDELTSQHYVAIPKKKEQLTDPSILTFDIADYVKNIQRNDHVVYEYEVLENTISIKSAITNDNVYGHCTTRKQHKTINRFWTITPEIATAIGMWYGDGCIRSKNDTKNNVPHIYGINIVAHENNKKLIDFWVNEIEKFTGLKSNIFHKGNNLIYAEISSPIVGEIFNVLFGKGFAGKKLHESMFKWSSDIVRPFMIGLISTDGCVSKGCQISLAMANILLVKQIYHLCSQIGENLSFYEGVKLKRGATELIGTLLIPKGWIQLNELYKHYDDDRLSYIRNRESKNCTYYDANHNVYTRVNNITQSSETPEYVYTLGIEDDHSYNVEGLVVENCFLLDMKSDSIDGIYDTLKQTALISKGAGGIGFNVHDVRAKNSYIKGTNGTAEGIVPMLRVFNDTARFVSQGGNKRKGSFAVYISDHHADIEDFLELKKNGGKEEMRCRDLFYAVWASDLFMERVEQNADWSLFCPNECPGLSIIFGDEFKELYEKYEREGRARKVIKAQALWMQIMTSQIETGTPYLMYKDKVNKHNNQSNLGTIKSSNLCSEITEFTDEKNIATCFTKDTKILTQNGLKNIIDCDGENIVSYFNNDIDLNINQHYEKCKLISNGVKNVYQLSTQGHEGIKATSNHMFLTVNKVKGVDIYNWKKLNKLIVGDKIVTPSVDPVYNVSINEDIDIDYLTGGWMLGDGWMSKNGWGVCFGPTDTYAHDIVVKKMNEWVSTTAIAKYGHNKLVSTFINKSGVMCWQSSKIAFKKLLADKFGFEQGIGPTKKIDDKIINSSSAEIANFLSGLFSSDGTVEFLSGKLSVLLSSSSTNILYTTQKLLLLFGITSRVHYGEVKTRPGRFQGTVGIRGEININRFLKSISFKLCPLKEEKLIKSIKNCIRKKGNVKRDWSYVTDIQYIGKEEVYDLALENSHNFIANGYVVHNCNLSSISLPACIKDGQFNHQLLYDITYHAIKDLNKVIDVNNYPVPEAKFSNMNNRPVAIGIQGLADLFILLRLPYDSPEAKVLNQEILETMYYAAAKSSCDLAKINGPYPNFKGSPTSKGILCPDSWKHTPTDRWNFNELRLDIVKYGLRNSLLIALMPTVSTAVILSNNESFEPYNTNIYVKRALAGEFVVINKHLLRDLLKLGIWNDYLKQQIIANNGSVQGIDVIPSDIQLLYRTVWEVPLKEQINMHSDRGVFVDQSQSFNVHMAIPNKSKLSSMHFYSWRLKGIKTSSYYVRSKAAVDPIKFTVDRELLDNQVILYTKPLCRYCILAKELLTSKNISYKEYNIEQPNYKLEMESKTNAKTVPQIFIGGKLIGGYDQLSQLYDNKVDEEPCILCSS